MTIVPEGGVTVIGSTYGGVMTAYKDKGQRRGYDMV